MCFDKWNNVAEKLPDKTANYLVVVGVNQFPFCHMYQEVRTALYNTVSKQWYVHESNKSIVGEVEWWCETPDVPTNISYS